MKGVLHFSDFLIGTDIADAVDEVRDAVGVLIEHDCSFVSKVTMQFNDRVLTIWEGGWIRESEIYRVYYTTTKEKLRQDLLNHAPGTIHSKENYEKAGLPFEGPTMKVNDASMIEVEQ